MTTSFPCDNITTQTRKTCEKGVKVLVKNRCKELRGKRPQTVIASFLGITQQAYSNIENSETPPKMSTCIKLSKFFGKPIDYIFPQIFLIQNTSKTC